ncbi:hypothetical protein [Aestuariivirga sp.]|uniref:hypothetical protein n=1 Tax=Aestuariivirga sp. TaxID=2650926 RepID=UPI00391C975C
MARFDLLDEYASIVLPSSRKSARPDWPERFEDSHSGILRKRRRTERPAFPNGLFLIILGGLALGLLGMSPL